MSKATYAGSPFVILLHRLAEAQAQRRLHREIAADLGMSRNFFANLITGQTALPMQQFSKTMDALGVRDEALAMMMFIACRSYAENKIWKSFAVCMDTMPEDALPGWRMYHEVLTPMLAGIEAGRGDLIELMLRIVRGAPSLEPTRIAA